MNYIKCLCNYALSIYIYFYILNTRTHTRTLQKWPCLQISKQRPKPLDLSLNSGVPAMGVASFKLVSWLLCTLAVDAFKLLDVGPPRTGTQTMHDAMKILGLKPLHTGYELSVRHALCGPLFSMGTRGIYGRIYRRTMGVEPGNQYRNVWP